MFFKILAVAGAAAVAVTSFVLINNKKVDSINKIDSKVQSDKIQTEEVNVQEGTDLKLEATAENTNLIAPVVPPEA